MSDVRHAARAPWCAHARAPVIALAHLPRTSFHHNPGYIRLNPNVRAVAVAGLFMVPMFRCCAFESTSISSAHLDLASEVLWSRDESPSPGVQLGQQRLRRICNGVVWFILLYVFQQTFLFKHFEVRISCTLKRHSSSRRARTATAIDGTWDGVHGPAILGPLT